jgi:hypothetical protein
VRASLGLASAGSDIERLAATLRAFSDAPAPAHPRPQPAGVSD